MFNKILVALDVFNADRRVFDTALALAQSQTAALMLLHVLSPFDHHYPHAPVLPGLDSYYPVLHDEAVKYYIQRWDTFQAQGLSVLQQRALEAITTGITTEFTQTPGDPGAVTCAVASTWKADLIVIGRRGRTGLNELFMGSVSNYVLHHAPCSVLTVQGPLTSHSETDSSTETVASH